MACGGPGSTPDDSPPPGSTSASSRQVNCTAQQLEQRGLTGTLPDGRRFTARMPSRKAPAEPTLSVVTARMVCDVAPSEAALPDVDVDAIVGRAETLLDRAKSERVRSRPKRLLAVYRRLAAEQHSIAEANKALAPAVNAEVPGAAERAETLGAAAREVDGATRSVLVRLTLAANRTWAADHPKKQRPPADFLSATEKRVKAGASFEELAAKADRAYRTSPGVAERHVRPLVRRLVPNGHPALEKRAMRVAVKAWRHHQTDRQIHRAVADLVAPVVVNDAFFHRVSGMERVYDRTVRMVRSELSKGRTPAAARRAVFAHWKIRAPQRDYSRVWFRGATVNRYTAELMLRAEAHSKAMGGPNVLSLYQGSYSTSVAASGGTHDGGGAIDVRLTGMTSAEVRKAVKALRVAGFAAWYRGPPSFVPHIHAIAIGDGDASPAAKAQVGDYRRGRDGLAYSRPDPDYHYAGRPIPNWAR